ncbi:hypothetical protein NMG60_11003084 [Bertholletia excelsa]
MELLHQILLRYLVLKSDSARLCLRCDSCVHSANCLSQRHPRWLICDKCSAQPAIVRCVDEKISLCQNCDWNGNCCLGPGHVRQTLSFYSGCPSQAEFSRIWANVLDVDPSCGGLDPGWEPPSSATPLIDDMVNCLSNCLETQNTGNEASVGLVTNKLNELQPYDKFESWVGSSSVIPQVPNCFPSYGKDQALQFSERSNLPKGCSTFKDIELNDGEDLCEGLNVDDVALDLESCNEIFGSSPGQSRYNFEGGGTDCQVIEKNASVTESNGHVEKAFETSPSRQQECLAFQSSCIAGSANNIMQFMGGTANSCMLMNSSCNRNINLGFPSGQMHSSISLSLSNITGESSAADYQDCGISPVFLTGESPWESNLEVSCPQARDRAKMRYNEKKKTRMFGKQIRYASRKARADTRKRVKGRFVKAGEAYDYDPLVTRDF